MRTKQFKQFPVYPIKAEGDSDSRVRKGIAAVFGNVDSWGDRIHNGAFEKTIDESRKRFKHLWNHDFFSPPIAKIVDIREVGKDELPDSVLEKSPEATGGLLVSREYYKDVPLADWVLKAIDSDDVNEMSFGYEIIASDETTETIGDKEVKIQELKELKLFDTSDVNWGMNSATVADWAKGSNGQTLPLGLLVQQFKDLVKSRDLVDAERELVEQIILSGLKVVGYPGADIPRTDPEPPAEDPLETKDNGADDAESSSLDRTIEFRSKELEFLTLKE